MLKWNIYKILGNKMWIVDIPTALSDFLKGSVHVHRIKPRALKSF